MVFLFYKLKYSEMQQNYFDKKRLASGKAEEAMPRDTTWSVHNGSVAGSDSV